MVLWNTQPPNDVWEHALVLNLQNLKAVTIFTGIVLENESEMLQQTY